ncbi:MAG: SIMPL domain-containing protein [Sphingomonadaceae bacterium]
MKLLASAAIAASALAGTAMAEGVTGPTILGARLDVMARGTVKRVPDVALISAGVVTQGLTAGAAMQANAAATARVLAALRKAGVAERDLTTAQITLSPQYRYADNRAPVITGYQASNSVSVRFRDIAASGGILDALVAAGANQINGPSLMIDKPEAALDEARVEAMRTARARADLYARVAGLTVKRIVAISESGEIGQPIIVTASRMRVQSSEASAASEIVPGEQDIGVSVSVTFELG